MFSGPIQEEPIYDCKVRPIPDLDARKVNDLPIGVRVTAVETHAEFHPYGWVEDPCLTRILPVGNLPVRDHSGGIATEPDRKSRWDRPLGSQASPPSERNSTRSGRINLAFRRHVQPT